MMWYAIWFVEEGNNNHTIIKTSSPPSSTTLTGSSLGPDIPPTTLRVWNRSLEFLASPIYNRPRALYLASLANSGTLYDGGDPRLL